MNRSERRRRTREQSSQGEQPKGEWRTAFDASPMAEGMNLHFLLYVLNEKEEFARYGKLLTATMWLQSQMVALISLKEKPELRALQTVDNGRHFPAAVAQAATEKLGTL